ncbi:MAG: aminotransferase class I/II-fold pyridoxal phosphate-dependent enzyme [Planctomycetota bacterium]|nr:aminotransferase class I/II-fold pyridoxal phosphate-dependent enzyme [Planctomycetota bacterium]MDI6786827.1 aminotransferase class I/II-fold pyridoxal phosphate-dependent enzyme [Planctomycetota bacterium]
MKVLKVRHIEWVKLLPLLRIRYPLMLSGVPSLKLNELVQMGFKLKDMPLYGDEKDAYGSIRLKTVLAQYYDVKPENIALIAGANMAVYMVCAVLLKPSDEIIIESPCYEPFRRAAQSINAIKIKYLPRRLSNNFQPDPAELKKLISPRTKLILLSNLHNPSGVKLDDRVANDLIKVIDKSGVYMAIDEVYRDFLFIQNKVKSKPDPMFKMHPRLITLSSLTKVYGLGYMRTGWLMAEPNLIYRFSRAYDYMSACDAYAAQMISLFCLQHINHLVERSREIVGKNLEIVKDWVTKQIENELALKWVPPDAGIICFIKLPCGINSFRFNQYLYKYYDTVVTPGEYFMMPGYIRLSFGVKANILKKGLNNITTCLYRQDKL